MRHPFHTSTRLTSARHRRFDAGYNNTHGGGESHTASSVFCFVECVVTSPIQSGVMA